MRRDIDGGAVFLAEDDEGAVGAARASAPDARPLAPRTSSTSGRARAARASRRRSSQACVAGGRRRRARRASASTCSRRTRSRATVWSRLGFEEVALVMATPLDALERRLAGTQVGAVARRRSTSRATTTRSVERAVAQFVPRLEAPQVAAAASGWIRDQRPAASTTTATRSARFARDLSDRLGAVVVALALEHAARRPLPPLRDAGAWSTSTSPCRRTTASCRRATSSRWRRTRRSSRA